MHSCSIYVTLIRVLHSHVFCLFKLLILLAVHVMLVCSKRYLTVKDRSNFLKLELILYIYKSKSKS
jgi:hypothetical protein